LHVIVDNAILYLDVADGQWRDLGAPAQTRLNAVEKLTMVSENDFVAIGNFDKQGSEMLSYGSSVSSFTVGVWNASTYTTYNYYFQDDSNGYVYSASTENGQSIVEIPAIWGYNGKAVLFSDADALNVMVGKLNEYAVEPISMLHPNSTVGVDKVTKIYRSGIDSELNAVIALCTIQDSGFTRYAFTYIGETLGILMQSYFMFDSPIRFIGRDMRAQMIVICDSGIALIDPDNSIVPICGTVNLLNI